MRTIEAPGVEINEIDKSQYSPAIVGTTALVMGFANKGEDYTAMQMTSRSAWVNYYGEPDNEAERYFYTACMEVINQNGKLYCAKIPYENEARDKYVVKKYTISTKCQQIDSVQNFISSDPDLVSLLDGDYTKYGFGIADLPGLSGVVDPALKSVLSNYVTSMLNIDKNIDLIKKYNQKRNAKTVAVPLFYKHTATEADDNWWYYNQVNTYERLSGMFCPDSQFWTDSETAKVSLSRAKFVDLNLSSLNDYLQDYMGAGNPTVTYDGIDGIFYKPEQYVEAYVKAYEDVFGSSATEYQPYNFNYAKLDSTDVIAPNFQHFVKDNAELFTKFDCIVCSSDADLKAEKFSKSIVIEYAATSSDTSIKAYDCVPYMYVDDSNHCNLMAYYTAAKSIIETKDISCQDAAKVVNDLSNFVAVGSYAEGTLTNKAVCSYHKVEYKFIPEGKTEPVLSVARCYLDKSATKDQILADLGLTDYTDLNITWTDKEALSSAPFMNLSAYFVGSLSLPLSVKFDEENIGLTQEQLTELINDLETFRHGKDTSAYDAIVKKLVVGKKVHTPYIKQLFDYYASNVNVSSYYDTSALYSDSATIDTMRTTWIPETNADGSIVVDAEGNAVLKETGIDFFKAYGNVVELSDYSDIYKKKAEQHVPFTFEENMEVLEAEFNKTITKPNLIDMVNKTRDLPEFSEIADYLKRTPATAELYYKFTQSKIEESLKYAEIRSADDTVQQYFSIRSNNNTFTLPITQIDEYKTDEDVVPPNQIYITDMTRSPYVHAADVNETECIGIVPIITTAANALVAQSIIENVTAGESYAAYQPLSSIATLNYLDPKDKKCKKHPEFTLVGDIELSDYNISSFCARELFSRDPNIETLAQEAAGYFTTMRYNDEGKLDRDNMYDIGVIVFKAYLDASEGNKISFSAVESYVGSLDRNAVNPNTGVSKFIDTIVNSQSEYINFFSNCYASTATRKEYDEECDILVVEPQKAGSLGFYEDMVIEDISIAKSIYDGLEKIFDKNQDINDKEIDIVCDAGISNIAQYIMAVYGTGKGPYDPASTEAAMFKLKSRNDTLTWRNTIQKYDNFCKNMRKDCMFIADGLRPFCLQGQKKIVRPTKPSNTIDANLLPNVKYMTGLNTNYGAGYCDWFQKADDFTGAYFWCPPSIQAMGIYIYTDVHAEYWDAPAGLNRGVVTALDVAFSPTMKQAGTLYNNNWNYAINYPQDGIVLEGQKTFQVKPSAFDRVNVRRLFLRLERATYKVARYFVYEGNTAYTRQRLIDTIDPIFADVKLRNGIYDYKIICDESINTPDVIDRNELKVKIGIKPVKTAEFILIDFIALTTGGSFDEM